MVIDEGEIPKTLIILRIVLLLGKLLKPLIFQRAESFVVPAEVEDKRSGEGRRFLM